MGYTLAVMNANDICSLLSSEQNLVIHDTILYHPATVGFQTANLKAEVERESTLTSFLTPEDENELIECNYAVLLAHFAK